MRNGVPADQTAPAAETKPATQPHG